MRAASSDSRLYLACPNRGVRGQLLAALRALPGIRASPQLDEGARNNKRLAVRTARAAKLTVDDRGDFVGAWDPRGNKPAKLRLVDVHLPPLVFTR